MASTGRIPKRCSACRTAKTAEPDTIRVATSDVAPLEDDGWPQQIAPLAWLDQRGRRYTDLGEAIAGADECRDR